MEREIVEYVNAVPWAILFDAYGRATPLKKYMLDLHDGTDIEKENAINEGLWGHAIHQYSYYTCTIFTVPPVVMALRDGVRYKTHELLGFLDECIKIGTYRLRWQFTQFPISIVRVFQLPFLIRVGLPSLMREIPKARAAYEELVRSDDPLVRERAEFLLKYCDRLSKRV